MHLCLLYIRIYSIRSSSHDMQRSHRDTLWSSIRMTPLEYSLLCHFTKAINWVNIAAPSWRLLFTHLIKLQVLWYWDVNFFFWCCTPDFTETYFMQIFVKVILYTSRPTNIMSHEPIWKHWWNLIVVLFYVAFILDQKGELE